MEPFKGKTVFSNGSYNPSQGTNAAMGYIKRGIKTGPFGGVSQFGSTGRSETRSGLARAALARMQNNKPKPPLPTGNPNPNEPGNNHMGIHGSMPNPNALAHGKGKKVGLRRRQAAYAAQSGLIATKTGHLKRKIK